MNRRWQLAVIAKAPVPGSVKTRLCPPFTFSQAAALAEAALRDTLEAALASSARRVLVVLEGDRGPWITPGVDVVAQRSGPFGERLQGAVDDAFSSCADPLLVIGMDTPQASSALLDETAALLSGADAVLGAADDGGYWVIGTKTRVSGLFTGVPMSTPETGRAQRDRLAALGLRCTPAPALRDVDRFDDARAVALLAPRTRFSAAFTRFTVDGPSSRALVSGGGSR